MTTYSDYRALSFDCYGTLIDWEAGIMNWADGWRRRTGVKLTPDVFLAAFSKHERGVQSELPATAYPDILAEVARRIATANGLPMGDEDARSFGQSVGDWPAFPDRTDALRALSERFKLVILSNVDRTSFARSNERLAVKFDAIITAEDVGSYKPDPQNFDTLRATVDGMGIARHELLHVGESLYHDVLPANRDEIDVVWIDRSRNRSNARASGNVTQSFTTFAEFSSMRDFAEAALSS